MIVGIDSSGANRLKKTGIEWYSYYLIQHLIKMDSIKGIDFVLYYPDKLDKKFKHTSLNWRFKKLNWPFSFFWTQIRLAIELLINRVDVLFSPSYFPPLIAFSKIKVTVIHDIGFSFYSEQYSFYKRIYYPLAHKRAINVSDIIIVPSKFTKNELLKKYKVLEEKIKVIPLAYNKDIYKLKSGSGLVLTKYKITKPFFLYVGRIEKKKNIDKLIFAYEKFCKQYSKQKHVPDLVLIGSSGYGYNKIKSIISNNAKIIKIGYIKLEDLPYFYSKATAFIFPSLYEGFGIPVLEAMACGCPVMTSNIPSLLEISANSCLYFNPNSIDDMAMSMKKITEDKELRNRLITKGLLRVKDFSWEKCAQQTMDIFINQFNKKQA